MAGEDLLAAASILCVDTASLRGARRAKSEVFTEPKFLPGCQDGRIGIEMGSTIWANGWDQVEASHVVV